MKRGQSPVVPYFRGGEGDGTFNGFVLSTCVKKKRKEWATTMHYVGLFLGSFANQCVTRIAKI